MKIDPNVVNVKIMRSDECTRLPSLSREGDACYDCFAADNVDISQGDRAKIPLGFHLAIPEGYEGVIRPRSGYSSKGVDVTIGTIDSNYRGEVSAVVVNNSKGDKHFRKGDKICQLAIRSVPFAVFEEVTDLDETNRGSNGFGSSGF